MSSEFGAVNARWFVDVENIDVDVALNGVVDVATDGCFDHRGV